MIAFGLRLKHGESFVVVTPGEDDRFIVEVLDAASQPVSDGDERKALVFLLDSISQLRRQVYNRLQR